MKAEQVLTASYEMTDEPLETDGIPGLNDAIETMREEQSDENILVRCEDRVANYDVYWNTKTDSVRIAAIMTKASYEVDDESGTLEDFIKVDE